MTNCIFNNKEIEINSESELSSLMKSGMENEFSEICFYEKDKTSLTVLTNKIEKKAFLMFQDLEEEISYVPIISKNPSELYVDFLLSNGQMDEYPKNWLVDFELAKKSIIEYFINRQMWNGINWNEE